MSATWIELDLSRLRRNLAAVRQLLPRAAHFILGVEGNAYGHGLAAVAPCAWSCGVKTYQAGGIEEAVALRGLLPAADVLVAGVADPADVPAVLEHRLTVMVVSEAHALVLARAAAARMAAVQAHAEIDTGMGLFGFDWQTGPATLGRLSRTPGLRLTGLRSTFAASDEDTDAALAEMQAGRFSRAIEDCRLAGVRAKMRYMADAAAMLRHPEWVMDGARPGLLAYGYPPRGLVGHDVACAPFLQWRARLVEVKRVEPGFAVGAARGSPARNRTRVGAVAAGYGDGVDARLGGRGVVLVGARACPVIGAVDLHAMAVDLGPDGPQKAGDEVVLLGTQGEAAICAADVADWCGTTTAAVLTAIRAGNRPAVPDGRNW